METLRGRSAVQTHRLLLLVFHQNMINALPLLKDDRVNGHSSNVCVCVYVSQGWYHLAGRPGGEAVHHFIHLLELLGHGLDLGVQVPVLCVLVVEHGPVLVPLLITADAGILPDEQHGDRTLVWTCTAPELQLH